MGLNKDCVRLENFTNIWKEMYLEEEKRLKELIGDYIISIEHVGSTSIPNLKSKPIIDIAITVNKLDDALKFSELLDDNGYDFRYDGGIEKEYLVRKGTPDNRTHYIHIVEKDSERLNNLILFRNYMLKHPEEVINYQNLKEHLASIYSDNRKMYTSSKNEYIQNILELAKKEFE